MENNNVIDYQYIGVPLTPAIIEEIVLSLFSGKIARRDSIVEEVVRFHDAHGGAKADVQNISNSVKKALKNLLDKGKQPILRQDSGRSASHLSQITSPATCKMMISQILL